MSVANDKSCEFLQEITNDVDLDERAKYFEQVENGVYIRMAIILTLLFE